MSIHILDMERHHMLQNCYSLYSQNCIQAQAYLYFTACLFCAPETLNTTTDRGLFWNQTVY